MSSLRANAHNETADATTVEIDTYSSSETGSFYEVVRDEIIEDFVDARNIGNDRSNYGCLIAQSLTAALKSDKRESASHVNSGSERPK